MPPRPIIDAGPALNFFSCNQERLLFDVLGALSTPETVYDEISRKAQQEQRFSSSQRVLGKLSSNLLEVLSDDYTDILAAAVHKVSGSSFKERLSERADLGETMAISHAVMMAEQGLDIYVLIDDQGGRTMAQTQASRLARSRMHTGAQYGSIRLLSTEAVLRRAAGTRYIPGKKEMRTIYERFRALDDGLIPIENTQLLSPDHWDQAR